MNNLIPQFSLRWNNYVNHVTGAFNILRLENDLVDVTLCCDGGKIKAHKVLLSACSSYFKQIFKETPCQHPVIIFRNVKYEDLNAIVNFMYHGEVNILQEQLESFLITAELLEVKGLTDGNDEDDDIKVFNQQFRNETTLDLSPSNKNHNVDTIESDPRVNEPINLATGPKLDYFSAPNSSRTSIDIGNENVSYTSSKPEATVSPREDVLDKPLLAAPNLPDNEMLVDDQSGAVEDLSDKSNLPETDLAKFRCQLCPKGFKHPTSLTLHRDSHAGKTQCPVCHRSFSRSYDMRSHLQRIHQGKQLTIKEIRYRSSNDTVAPKTFTHHI